MQGFLEKFLPRPCYGGSDGGGSGGGGSSSGGGATTNGNFGGGLGSGPANDRGIDQARVGNFTGGFGQTSATGGAERTNFGGGQIGGYTSGGYAYGNAVPGNVNYGAFQAGVAAFNSGLTPASGYQAKPSVAAPSVPTAAPTVTAPPVALPTISAPTTVTALPSGLATTAASDALAFGDMSTLGLTDFGSFGTAPTSSIGMTDFGSFAPAPAAPAPSSTASQMGLDNAIAAAVRGQTVSADPLGGYSPSIGMSSRPNSTTIGQDPLGAMTAGDFNVGNAGVSAGRASQAAIGSLVGGGNDGFGRSPAADFGPRSDAAAVRGAFAPSGVGAVSDFSETNPPAQPSYGVKQDFGGPLSSPGLNPTISGLLDIGRITGQAIASDFGFGQNPVQASKAIQDRLGVPEPESYTTVNTDDFSEPVDLGTIDVAANENNPYGTPSERQQSAAVDAYGSVDQAQMAQREMAAEMGRQALAQNAQRQAQQAESVAMEASRQMDDAGLPAPSRPYTGNAGLGADYSLANTDPVASGYTRGLLGAASPEEIADTFRQIDRPMPSGLPQPASRTSTVSIPVAQPPAPPAQPTISAPPIPLPKPPLVVYPPEPLLGPSRSTPSGVPAQAVRPKPDVPVAEPVSATADKPMTGETIVEKAQEAVEKVTDAITDPIKGLLQGEGADGEADAESAADKPSFIETEDKGWFRDRGDIETVDALVFHHTGPGSRKAHMKGMKARGVAVQFMIDRDGTVHQLTKNPNSKASHTSDSIKNKRWTGAGNPRVSSSTAIGVEVIAKNNADVTKAQIEAGAKLASWLAKQPFASPDMMVTYHGAYQGDQGAAEARKAGRWSSKQMRQADEGKAAADYYNGLSKDEREALWDAYMEGQIGGDTEGLEGPALNEAEANAALASQQGVPGAGSWAGPFKDGPTDTYDQPRSFKIDEARVLQIGRQKAEEMLGKFAAGFISDDRIRTEALKGLKNLGMQYDEKTKTLTVKDHPTLSRLSTAAMNQGIDVAQFASLKKNTNRLEASKPAPAPQVAQAAPTPAEPVVGPLAEIMDGLMPEGMPSFQGVNRTAKADSLKAEKTRSIPPQQQAEQTAAVAEEAAKQNGGLVDPDQPPEAIVAVDPDTKTIVLNTGEVYRDRGKGKMDKVRPCKDEECKREKKRWAAAREAAGKQGLLGGEPAALI